MWFSMPKGCGRISVELQQFAAEATDENGVNYFRAPDHFAPRILAIAGFAKAEPPAGSPDDLPKADPLRDSAIAELTGEMSALRIEAQNLRSDVNAANARNAALVNDNAKLQSDLVEANRKIEGLEEKLEDLGASADVVPIKKAGGK